MTIAGRARRDAPQRLGVPHVCAVVALAAVLPALANASGADAALRPLVEAAGGNITGRVIAAASKAPIEGVSVCSAQDVGVLSFKEHCAKTNANGEYTLGGLATANYLLGFYAPAGSGYVNELYDGDTAFTEAAATRVPVTVEATTTGIDAEMQRAAGPGGVSGQGSASGQGSHVPESSPASSTAAEAVQLAGPVKRVGGAVLIALRCVAGASSCDLNTVGVQLTVVELVSRGRVVAVTAASKRAAHARTIIIGGAHITSWSDSMNKTVRVVLSRAGRKLIARFKTLMVHVRISSGGRTLMNRNVRIT